MAKKEQLEYQIKKIYPIKSSFNTPSNINFEKDKDFKFDLSVDYKLDKEAELLVVITNVEVYFANKKKSVLASESLACVFLIKNFSSVISEKDIRSMKDEFRHLLTGLSISTLRGHLFSKFRGTYLHNAILPIVDPSKFTLE